MSELFSWDGAIMCVLSKSEDEKGQNFEQGNFWPVKILSWNQLTSCSRT